MDEMNGNDNESKIPWPVRTVNIVCDIITQQFDIDLDASK